ncbi:hypothetical protein [Glutamicibacter arilaitensis]|uniref:Uncharacterized protein n=1 Tax=Glutamicibacter arilaitensis TaxID=256701 RepID=A0A2N7S5J7_9MICC|nr:hypothetical protein [Glutamicibacter arilaitensis]PMQ21377.1 hypothetical protein CIK84_07445 [Glutamicibacter arilaitensis]
MSLVTPKYSIPYLTPGDKMLDIPAVDKQQSLRIESLLETANVPPGNPDLNDVLARLNQLEALTYQSSGVMTFTNSNFEVYSARQTVGVFRFGKVVYFAGSIRCVTANYLDVTSDRVIGTIPAEFRPAQYFGGVMQGSGTSKFYLRVESDGRVIASRAGTHNNNYWMSTGATWLAA